MHWFHGTFGANYSGLCNIQLFQDESNSSNVIIANAVSYCEATTIHGFSYWVSAENIVEKLFWVLTVVIGFTCSSLIVSSAIQGWLDEPGVTVIKTFSKVVFINLHLNLHLISLDNPNLYLQYSL